MPNVESLELEFSVPEPDPQENNANLGRFATVTYKLTFTPDEIAADERFSVRTALIGIELPGEQVDEGDTPAVWPWVIAAPTAEERFVFSQAIVVNVGGRRVALPSEELEVTATEQGTRVELTEYIPAANGTRVDLLDEDAGSVEKTRTFLKFGQLVTETYREFAEDEIAPRVTVRSLSATVETGVAKRVPQGKELRLAD